MDRPFRTEKVYRSIYLFFVQSRYSIQFDFIIIILVTNLTNSYYCIIKINKYCPQLVVKISFVSLVPCSQISVSVCVWNAVQLTAPTKQVQGYYYYQILSIIVLYLFYFTNIVSNQTLPLTQKDLEHNLEFDMEVEHSIEAVPSHKDSKLYDDDDRLKRTGTTTTTTTTN